MLPRPPGRLRSAPLSLDTLASRALLSGIPAQPLRAVDSSAYDPTHVLVRFRPGTEGNNQLPALLSGAMVTAPAGLGPGLREVQLGPGVRVGDALRALRA